MTGKKGRVPVLVGEQSHFSTSSISRQIRHVFNVRVHERVLYQERAGLFTGGREWLQHREKRHHKT